MKRWHGWVLSALTALSIFLEFVAPHQGGHDYWWTHIPAFFVFYGFIGCAAIVYLSKWYGKILVQRKEGYYEKLRPDPDEAHDATTGQGGGH